jgi:type II restriction enzyme
MKQSEGLRNHLEGNVKNIESQKQDSNIKVVVEDVLSGLRKMHPTLEFGVDNIMKLRDIEKYVNGENYTTSATSYIKPDGGFMWLKINGEKRYILVSEQKRQGTNDIRLIEGKPKQSVGNAVERLGKNVNGLQILFQEEDIFPFIVFLQGCDFCDKETNIPDRVRTIAGFQPLNTLNIYKKKGRAGSYFMRGHSMYEKPGTSDWTNEEMYNNMFTIAVTAVNYYLEKYGK